MFFGSRENSGPKKTITIRGVDRELYDQFTKISHRMGINLGDLFQHMVKPHGNNRPYVHRFFHRIHIRKSHTENRLEHVEVIENEEELIINKADLVDTGANTRFIFRNIKHLEFDASVDNQTLLKYVERIYECGVNVDSSEISKLFLLSISDSHKRHLPPSSDHKDVTIRNVNEEVYEEFRGSCQIKSKNLGQCFNELLGEVIPRLEVMQIMTHNIIAQGSKPLVVSMVDELKVTRQDLLDLVDRQVLFHRIQHLEFDDDIEKELFINSVIGIYNSTSKLPSSTPKLIAKARVKNYPN